MPLQLSLFDLLAESPRPPGGRILIAPGPVAAEALLLERLDALLAEIRRDPSRLGRPVRVATAEGLILLKLLASRSRDVTDIEALLATNQGRLDLAWVEQEWLTLFEADDPRWVRFRQAVAEHYDSPGPA